MNLFRPGSHGTELSCDIHETEAGTHILEEMTRLDIQSIIRQKLDDIEQQENVKILHAVESGSRSWGFASPDSDYDVRFIYVRPREYYLRLDRTPDVIEWQLDETLDINGWDLKKALILLHQSNPTVFEWKHSPIIYRTTPLWTQISPQIDSCFIEKKGLYHYLHMAKTNYRGYLRGETVRLKKYFYVLRPVMAAYWILERHSPPPMLFSELKAAMLTPELHPVVDRLLALKTETPEMGEGIPIPELNAYLDRSIAEIEVLAGQTKGSRGADWALLNRLFLSAVPGSDI